MKASKTLITLTHSSIDGLHQERAMKMRMREKMIEKMGPMKKKRMRRCRGKRGGGGEDNDAECFFSFFLTRKLNFRYVRHRLKLFLIKLLFKLESFNYISFTP